MRKISSTLALFAVSQVLEWSGYIPPVFEGGRLVEQAQTSTFILVLRLVFVFFPVLLISFGIFFASRFPLSVALYRRLENLLVARRRGEVYSAASASEAQELTRLLTG